MVEQIENHSKSASDFVNELSFLINSFSSFADRCLQPTGSPSHTDSQRRQSKRVHLDLHLFLIRFSCRKCSIALLKALEKDLFFFPALYSLLCNMWKCRLQRKTPLRKK